MYQANVKQKYENSETHLHLLAATPIRTYLVLNKNGTSKWIHFHDKPSFMISLDLFCMNMICIVLYLSSCIYVLTYIAKAKKSWAGFTKQINLVHTFCKTFYETQQLVFFSFPE